MNKKRYGLELLQSDKGWSIEIYDNRKEAYLPVVELGKCSRRVAEGMLLDLDDKYNGAPWK